MFNRRFMPYIVGACVAGLLFVCYIGYREYEKHVAFERFISDTEAFSRSVEHPETDGHTHLTDTHPHGGENPDLNTAVDTTNPYYKGKQGDEYVYMAGGKYVYSVAPLDREYLELYAWEITGEKTPYVEKHLKRLAENSPYKDQIVQRIVTPDGQLHNVIVPHDRQYEEGDVILQSELDPPILEALEQDQRPARVEIAGAPIPDEYYTIEDPYERHEFIKKVMFSKQLKISMAALEAKIAKGEIDVSLSAREKETVDNNEAMKERERMLKSFAKPIPSDKPPVKVSFLSDTAEDTLPGWMRKMQGTLPSGSGEAVSDGNYSAADPFSEGSINEDTRGAPVGSDVPVSPLDLPDIVNPTPSPPSVTDIEKQLKPEGIESELTEGLSPERFDKAQRLIDQFGTAEGLRRLRAMDPEAARQFERESPPKPARNVPDSEESQR